MIGLPFLLARDHDFAGLPEERERRVRPSSGNSARDPSVVFIIMRFYRKLWSSDVGTDDNSCIILNSHSVGQSGTSSGRAGSPDARTGGKERRHSPRSLPLFRAAVVSRCKQVAPSIGRHSLLESFDQNRSNLG